MEYRSQSSEEQIDQAIDIALAEDLSRGDVTTDILIPRELQGEASVLVKAEGVLAGIEIAGLVFHKVDPALNTRILIKDGAMIRPGDIAATINGRVASILKAERTALNFLCRLSGIATQTAQYVAKTKGHEVRVTDTRKTTPGLRLLEKYAVLMGGGHNHRFHLGDGILIKDNHLVALRALGISLKESVARAKQAAPRGLKVEVETTNAREVQEAVAAGADIIMLDNMPPDEIRRVIGLIPDGITIEASGGINLTNIEAVAATGVHLISIGALTHSVKVLDISLELEPASLKMV
ncbi:MAG: carboxylating nicotinate-nucleotide diphosphorylase [Dehalococcoidales bacterium]|nr:carboxylating nicotinate-nucleotide diphosphorylase [Dehalococcoidales bacterium]